MLFTLIDCLIFYLLLFLFILLYEDFPSADHAVFIRRTADRLRNDDPSLLIIIYHDQLTVKIPESHVVISHVIFPDLYNARNG